MNNEESNVSNEEEVINAGPSFDQNGNQIKPTGEVVVDEMTVLQNENPELAEKVTNAGVVLSKTINIVNIVVCSIILFITVLFTIFTITTSLEQILYKDNSAVATITSIDYDNQTYTLTYTLNGEEKTLEQDYFDGDSVEVGEQFKLYFDNDGNLKLTTDTNEHLFPFFDLIFPVVLCIFMIISIVKSVKILKHPNDPNLTSSINISFGN